MNDHKNENYEWKTPFFFPKGKQPLVFRFVILEGTSTTTTTTTLNIFRTCVCAHIRFVSKRKGVLKTTVEAMVLQKLNDVTN